MAKLRVAFKWTIVALSFLAFGIAALPEGTAQAVIPEPECGPTRQWTCVVPGCPHCYEVLFEGTVCEKNAFEKKTGRVCSPI